MEPTAVFRSKNATLRQRAFDGRLQTGKDIHVEVKMAIRGKK